jgi:putative hydrolase of the HAD superfamily
MRYDTLFLDIGGVLLTNGWDHKEREGAAKLFNLDWEDFEQRHDQYYPSHERGEITLDDYLEKVVFWKARDFSRQQFRDQIFAQSKPLPEMLRLMREIKLNRGVRIAAVSNEGRDLADFRIKTFHLDDFIDDFFVSSYVGIRKPDERIYKLALEVTQVNVGRILYIDDRQNLVEAAAKIGIYGFTHTDFKSTKAQLESYS